MRDLSLTNTKLQRVDCRPWSNTKLFWIQILFCTFLSSSGVSEHMKYSQKVKTAASLGWLSCVRQNQPSTEKFDYNNEFDPGLMDRSDAPCETDLVRRPLVIEEFCIAIN